MVDFTEESLPRAIRLLFELNNYAVRENVHLHGAQIDLVATSISDPFSSEIYVEATIQRVDTAKFGKDATKFLTIRERDTAATCLCVSSSGFTAEVIERANASRVQTLTYDELFRRFEKFSPYVDHIIADDNLSAFDNTYEEPFFRDNQGEELATPWLQRWRDDPASDGKWLIVLGEYGTGKTSLTRVLQYRWTNDYLKDPSLPIPFRIELRTFTRQFDARTLIHHFLDSNNLGHIPIEFVYHLMRSGRIILLLDGYDEMAQFLNSRERRSCLGALAQLATDGAKGILTSRPNYFTETEELRVFEALYSTLEQNRYYISKSDKEFFDKERAIDNLVTKYLLDRFERHIRDLDRDQTESLVRRKLAGDAEGQSIILGLLQRVFREESGGSKIALSGKPVIIAYLLELIDDIRTSEDIQDQTITEWQIYRMIVDRLMLRDQQRSPLDPQRRRRCLQQIAMLISTRDTAIAREVTFDEVIDTEFKSDFRLMDADERRHRRDELFEDLRGSATLTRAEGGGGSGWIFSHNSLREYLCVELMLSSLLNKNPIEITVPITQAMKSFAASVPVHNFSEIVSALQSAWHGRHSRRTIGLYLTLLWDRTTLTGLDQLSAVKQILGTTDKSAIPLDGIRLSDVSFGAISTHGSPVALSFDGSELSNIVFDDISINHSTFAGSVLDSCSFRRADLSWCDFSRALLFECDLTSASIEGAIFNGIDPDSSIFVKSRDSTRQLAGKSAIGYLNYNGGVKIGRAHV